MCVACSLAGIFHALSFTIVFGSTGPYIKATSITTGGGGGGGSSGGGQGGSTGGKISAAPSSFASLQLFACALAAVVNVAFVALARSEFEGVN